jgi:hypothetical protein
VKPKHDRKEQNKKSSTLTSKIEPPVPQVFVCYIRNEGERNQKRTPRNQIKNKMVKREKKKKKQAP